MPPIIAALEKEKATVIESEVMADLQKARKLNTDVFGFVMRCIKIPQGVERLRKQLG